MEAARTILEENIIGTLATVNSDNTAWATPLHIFFDDEAVYWFSHQPARHSKNILNNPSASVVVFSPDKTDGLKAAYFNGTATILNKAASDAARQLVLSRLGSIPETFASAAAYKLPFGSLNTEKSFGNCWYFYS